MKKILATMMALLLTVSAQAQAQDDGLAELMSAMIAAKVHQDSIDVASLVAVYDYECQTQDAEGKAVTDGMKLCLLVGQHCTRSFPYRKFRMERQWASRQNPDMRSRAGRNGQLEFFEGYDFFELEELPTLRAESYCHVPEVWTNHPDGQVTVRDAIPPTIYETREARKPISWTLCDDTVTIGGYLCKTATCQLHGLRWTVRYAEDIPTSAGPWKLCGLPGLILAAEAGPHRFMLSDIPLPSGGVRGRPIPIYYETSAITTKTTEAKLIKKRIETFGNRLYLKSPQRFVRDNGTADYICDTEGELINGVYVHDKPHIFQPLELEK